MFTQNVFLVHAQTILEVNDVFVQFYCLSSCQYDFVSKRPVSSLRYHNMAKVAKLSSKFALDSSKLQLAQFVKRRRILLDSDLSGPHPSF